MTKLIKRYLDLNNYSNSKNDFEEAFLSHPNYPSIFAITDTLNLLNIDNLAVKVPKEQLIELPDLFMAVFNDNLVLVHKTILTVIIENDKKKETISFNDFLNGWNEIIVFIEPNTTVFSNTKINNNKLFLQVLPILFLISLSLFNNHYSFSNFILLFLSLSGLILSIFIVQEKLGIKNEIVSKICNINPKSSCEDVIKSTKSQLNKWLGFSDLPLLFFSVNVLSILILPQQSSFFVGYLSLLAMPFLLYSVWIQKFQIKKWCILCLLVAAVIFVQGLIFLTTNFKLSNFNFTLLSKYLFYTVLVTSIWFFIKPILEAKIKIELEIDGLKK